jgi:hypothetical protein
MPPPADSPTPGSADAPHAGWIGRAAAALVALLAVVVAVIVLGGGGSGTAARTEVPANWQKGANFTAWWHDEHAGPTSDQRLRALRATGSDSIELVVTWYQLDRFASAMEPDPLLTPTDESLLHAITVAHALGMRVALKPHIDLRDGRFRGDLKPASTERWFDAYRTMLDHYALLAATARAEMLVVGTELDSMTHYESEWRSLIATARGAYGGPLTFAANWIDGAEAIRFWNALDYVGVDFYMPLGTPLHASAAQLARAWRSRRYVQRLQRLHDRYHRSVIFTEIGFASRGRPQHWATPTTTPADQAAAYQATYAVWAQVPWFRGLYWWDWRAGNRTDNGAFDPDGHPAEAVMARWNGPAPPACTPPAGPTGPTGATAASDAVAPYAVLPGPTARAAGCPPPAPLAP